jgi:hypothetical protein
MTLENLKDYWQTVSLKHKDVEQFLVGNNYDIANNTDDKYPLCFYELPYTVDMNLDKPIDTIQFAFNVFLYTKQDDINDSHQAISLAKAIGDAIIMKVKSDTSSGFNLTAANAISVREYSDDYVAGVRYDITITMKRDICTVDINEYFNDAE